MICSFDVPMTFRSPRSHVEFELLVIKLSCSNIQAVHVKHATWPRVDIRHFHRMLRAPATISSIPGPHPDSEIIVQNRTQLKLPSGHCARTWPIKVARRHYMIRKRIQQRIHIQVQKHKLLQRLLHFLQSNEIRFPKR